MYSILGWFNIIVMITITAPYWMNLLNKKLFKTKNKNYFKVVKIMRAMHKPLGLVLLILGFVHGILALGSFRIHTGSLLWFSMIITALLGGIFYKTKTKSILIFHRGMALITVLLLLIHLIFPGAVYKLFSI